MKSHTELGEFFFLPIEISHILSHYKQTNVYLLCLHLAREIKHGCIHFFNIKIKKIKKWLCPLSLHNELYMSVESNM